MAKHPNDRYRSASDLAAAIRRALAQHGLGPLVADFHRGLYPSQTAAQNAAVNAQTARSREPTVAARAGLRSQRALRFVAAALALFIIVGITLL